MRERAAWTVAAIVASALATSCAGASGEPSASSSQPIIGGDADVSDVAVVAIQQSAGGTLCSGTLIAPTIVLTAAHCVYGVSASALQVIVGEDVSNPTQTLAVASVAAYPTYTSEASGLVGGIDLGVVVLAEPLSSVAPVPLDTTSTDAELAVANVTLVGFGETDPGDTSQVGVRSSVTTAVTTVCSRTLTLGDANGNQCFGDSGGAVLLNGKLVATISSGSADCTAPSTQMRLSAHKNWLASVIAGNTTAACPSCVEPDTSCGAATETAPATSEDAGSGEDAGPGAGDDAGSGDASASAPAGSHGGCAVAAPGNRTGDGGVLAGAMMAAFAARGRRRRRKRRVAPSVG